MTYVLAGLFLNFYALQVFCIPVWWAAIYSGICFSVLIFFPLFRNALLRTSGYFLLGAGVPVSGYCLLFLDFPVGYLIYIPGILFFGAGLAAFLPFYQLYHTWRYFTTGSAIQKKLLLTGFVLPILSFAVYFLIHNPTYNQLENHLSGSKTYLPETAEKLPASYLTERVLGVGFKYHTSLDFVYDGWRPPLHDPFFNLFIWIRTGGSYPFPALHLAYRMAYYQKLFPEKPLRIKCACSFKDDAQTYFRSWDLKSRREAF